MSSKLCHQASQQIVERLQGQAGFNQGQTILAYFSTRQEPDLSRLWAVDSGLRFGFPRCEQNSQLRWHSWRSGDELITGKFGIREPSPLAPVIEVAEVDWILVPAVGCDRRGYRIGYGGGFYDRLLENPRWREIPTIGITFDLGIVESVPVEAWDVPLHYICTEKEWITCT